MNTDRPILLSDSQLAQRLNLVERLMLQERDEKNLPSLVDLFQRLLNEQARRDVAKETK